LHVVCVTGREESNNEVKRLAAHGTHHYSSYCRPVPLDLDTATPRGMAVINKLCDRCIAQLDSNVLSLRYSLFIIKMAAL